MSSEAGSALPFSGLKVLDLSWVMVGPTVARYFADYGATVIHVESPLKVDTARTLPPFKDSIGGVGRSAFHTNINTNKLGLSLNLNHPEARKLVLTLTAWADMLLESFTPRVMRSWGLTYERLVQVKPDLIMISTCLFGQTGPDAEFAGYGNLAAAVSGFVGLIGWPDRDPAGPFGAYTDYIAPKFIAAAAMAALDHRRRTGQGQYIDAAQAESALYFIAPAILEYAAAGRLPQTMGNRSLEAAPHGVYPCKGEEQWVALAVHDDGQWERLTEVACQPQWKSDPRFATAEARRHNQDALDQAIQSWTVERIAEEVEQLLQAARVPAHKVLSTSEINNDPQLASRGHFVETNHPELGKVFVERSRFKLSRGEKETYTPGPTYGQHNDLVLREILGLGDKEIENLKATGAIA